MAAWSSAAQGQLLGPRGDDTDDAPTLFKHGTSGSKERQDDSGVCPCGWLGHRHLRLDLCQIRSQAHRTPLTIRAQGRSSRKHLQSPTSQQVIIFPMNLPSRATIIEWAIAVCQLTCIKAWIWGEQAPAGGQVDVAAAANMTWRQTIWTFICKWPVPIMVAAWFRRFLVTLVAYTSTCLGLTAVIVDFFMTYSLFVAVSTHLLVIGIGRYQPTHVEQGFLTMASLWGKKHCTL